MKPTPPKSLDRIRSALESIRHEAPSTADRGPLSEGLKPEDRLVIATFYDREVRKRFQDLLLANGINSLDRRSQGRDQVLVDMSDRQTAARLLDEHLLAWPDRPQARGRRMIDFLLLGGVLGATISVAFVAGILSRLPHPSGVLIALVRAVGLERRMVASDGREP